MEPTVYAIKCKPSFFFKSLNRLKDKCENYGPDGKIFDIKMRVSICEEMEMVYREEQKTNL